MWYLCIHCAGRVIDVLMQPKYRKCWRPTWLAKSWVFKSILSLSTHERRNEHNTRKVCFLRTQRVAVNSDLAIHLSSTQKSLFSAGNVCPNPSDPTSRVSNATPLVSPRSFSAVERKMNFSKLSRTSLGFESVPKASLIYFCAWEASTKWNLSHFLGKLLTQFC